MGASHGWSKEADSGVVRIWELVSGVSVAASKQWTLTGFRPKEYAIIPVQKTIEALPPVWKEDCLEFIRNQVKNNSTSILIVLDDDPTGTQTCHDIPVLTGWDYATLCSELRNAEGGFFILTNSRALPSIEAKILVSAICRSISRAAEDTGRSFQIVLRGDSTLRGHFPEEPEAVEEIFGGCDAWILAPFFLQGGRYTIDDVHYVAEKAMLVPASQTPFAADATFGYKSSNLRDYIIEKASSRFTGKDILSISIEDIRLGGPSKVTERLLKAPKGCVVILNAAAEEDIHVFAAGALAAERLGKKYLYRTGAAFVSSRLGISGKAPMSAKDLGLSYGSGKVGGIIIAGSYVPKTTAQLKSLRERRGNKLHVIELDVEKLMKSSEEEMVKIGQGAINDANNRIKDGTDVLVMTSRLLITGQDGVSSLQIGGAIAAALVRILQGIDVRPRYIIAKVGASTPFSNVC